MSEKGKPDTNFYMFMSTRTTIYLLCDWCGNEMTEEDTGYGSAEDRLNHTLNKKGWVVEEERMTICPSCHKERVEKQPQK